MMEALRCKRAVLLQPVCDALELLSKVGRSLHGVLSCSANHTKNALASG